MTPPRPHRLLVVDDEPDLRTLYELTLLRDGHDVETAGCVDDAVLSLQDRQFDAVITDMRLPDGSGLDVLRHLEQHRRPEKVIVITAYGSAENAVEALRAGAFDYLTKPVDLKQFRSVVSSALASRDSVAPVLRDVSQLKRQESRQEARQDAQRNAAAAASNPAPGRPGTPPAPPVESAPTALPEPEPSAPDTGWALTRPSAALTRLAGRSSAMDQVRRLIEKVAQSMAPVQLFGESGTGKELVARAIHDVSSRRTGPFIAVNCGAIPEQLLESEFFGYRKGSFTGANEDREGVFQAAQGGTLFLDEIGDLPLSMQAKLLRAIQERAVRPLGATAEVPLDVRIISATHKDLSREVRAGQFRQDLFYRLNVIQIPLPPLRERREDLRTICDQILRRIALEAGLPSLPLLDDSAHVALASYGFPGNVRELENILNRAVTLCAGHLIGVTDLGLPHPGHDPASFEPPPTRFAHEADGALAPRPPLPDTRPQASRTDPTLPPDGLPDDLAAHLDDIERRILTQALERHRLNRTAAGARLGLSLRQMRYRMARLGIQIGTEGIELGERRDVGDGDAEL